MLSDRNFNYFAAMQNTGCAFTYCYCNNDLWPIIIIIIIIIIYYAEAARHTDNRYYNTTL